MLHLVCQTEYIEDLVEDDVPDCRLISEQLCTSADASSCSEVTRTVCNITTETNTKLTPLTDCQKIRRDVCGPEACPLVAGELQCRVQSKMVRCDSVERG